ncbi:MAG: hypothetical protein NT132_04185 [Microbacterium sp.]|uniref:hypothetical protein n=1 Tax=Microbacterium sp. TaxID=51671 RepID=UPI00262EED3E|nr:hypothetical protein [Microbacterium sp.]MCX6501597.1 hypothetical protein [Microbacterium sp.]
MTDQSSPDSDDGLVYIQIGAFFALIGLIAQVLFDPGRVEWGWYEIGGLVLGVLAPVVFWLYRSDSRHR